jgi:hypothetical protein
LLGDAVANSLHRTLLRHWQGIAPAWFVFTGQSKQRTCHFYLLCISIVYGSMAGFCRLVGRFLHRFNQFRQFSDRYSWLLPREEQQRLSLLPAIRLPLCDNTDISDPACTNSVTPQTYGPRSEPQ